MTKEFLGNIRVHRKTGEEKKKNVSGGCVFLVPVVSVSHFYPINHFLMFEIPLSLSLTCAPFFALNVGHGGGAESSPN